MSIEMAERLKELENLTGSLVARRPAASEIDQRNAAPAGLIPAPRHSRVFLRQGEGHGTFADLTLTAPVVRSYLS